MTIRLEAVSKCFGNVTVVRDFDLEIADAEFFTLLGSSGSGKTTLLRLIAGFERPDAGRILIGDRVVADAGAKVFVPPEKRGLGMVFQSYALWPHLDVHSNLALGLEQKRFPPASAKEKISTALAMVGLTGLERRYPSELSGGQQQRVALARALVLEPSVLLLDEPLSNLDAVLREAVREEIHALQRKLGIIALLVTHDQIEAMSVSDRIAILQAGKIAELGAPQSLYHTPKTAFAAGFLGRTNLLRGMASRGVVRIGCADLPVATIMQDGDVTVMVRPEVIEFVDAGSGLNGLIRRVTMLGSITRYEIAVPALASALVVDRTSAAPILQGDVHLHLAPERIVPLGEPS